MQNNLEAALTYAEKFQFSIIPIRPDKKPYIPWAEFQKRRATTEEIRSWWKQWPAAMVGIVTGEISGVLAVDCDNEEAYKKIQEYFPIPLSLALLKLREVIIFISFTQKARPSAMRQEYCQVQI